VPTFNDLLAMVGTLRFAHPTIPIQISKSLFGVIARLDRAIQYSRDGCAQAEAPLEYWMARSAGP
jgi:hypothetical protein